MPRSKREAQQPVVEPAGDDEVHSFKKVFLDELNYIDCRRGEQFDKKTELDSLHNVQEHAIEKDLCGLAISGGGIRSATFGLGVLQGLAKAKLLGRFDYLSTVSGGGYIGSFLSKWVHKEGIAKVEEELTGGLNGKPDFRIHARNSSNVAPIKHLRQYSNYLAPTPGLLSIDGWLLFAIYLRNLFLNQAVMLLAALSLFIAIRGVAELFCDAMSIELPFWIFFVLELAILLIVIFFNYHFFKSCEIRRYAQGDSVVKTRAKLWWRLSGASVAVLALYISLMVRLDDKEMWWVYAISTVAASALGFGLLGLVCRPRKKDPVQSESGNIAESTSKNSHVARLFAGLISGLIGGLVLVGLLLITTESVSRSICFSVPAILLSFVISEMIYVGLLRESLRELEREWWSSMNSRMMILAATWCAVASVAIYSPWLLGKLLSLEWAMLFSTIIGTGWIGTILAGLLSANSENTGNNKNKALELIAKLAPFAFLGLVLFCVSVLSTWAAYDAYARLAPDVTRETRHEVDAHIPPDFWTTIKHDPALVLTDLDNPTPPIMSIPVALVLFAAAAVLFGLSQYLSRLIGVNTFSLHNMYANRLVRCYLGATNRTRRGNGLTNFDDRDDIPLSQILPSPETCSRISGPIHIINAALSRSRAPSNLGAEPQDFADALSVRDRKAESFIFSPMYSGSESTGYCSTRQFGGENGITLGNALAVSGAAVSPNMGYHSSPGITALLTVFNLRLGAWFGNPNNKKTRPVEDPSVGLGLLATELSGNTDAKCDYVYISDGGHFENMGIYELLRRRCRFVVAVDADAAPNIRENVGRIVRLARIDFGIRIEIDPTSIIPDENGNCAAHLVVGRIHYGDVHRDGSGGSKEQPPHDPSFNYNNKQGILVWISLATTGDESADLRNYVKMNPDFPYRSTKDQFFDESEFESYRELGEHSVESMLRYFSLHQDSEIQQRGLENAADIEQIANIEQRKKTSFMYTLENVTDTATYNARHDEMVKLFNATKTRDIFSSIYEQWLAQPDRYIDGYIRQNERLLEIVERLKNDDRLRRLANEIFVGVRDVEPTQEQWFVEKLMIGEMMTFLENVWLTLDLEHQYLHPVHRGWLGMFKNWVRSPSFDRYWYSAENTEGLESEFTPAFVRFVESVRRIES